MLIEASIERIRTRSGDFLCEAIGDKTATKLVKFFHIIGAPTGSANVPAVGDVEKFYSLVGSLTLFVCSDSDEAACYIGHPSEWEALEEGFAVWVDMLDEEEHEQVLPSWFYTKKVIGDIPSSGNYILLVTAGENAGAIYEFEHDGFEFKKLGSSISELILYFIDPGPESLSKITSHMCFISASSDQQWWVKELHHDSGKVVISAD